jgi:hypothetical protein
MFLVDSQLLSIPPPLTCLLAPVLLLSLPPSLLSRVLLLRLLAWILRFPPLALKSTGRPTTALGRHFSLGVKGVVHDDH